MEKIKRFYAHIEGMIWFLKLKKKQEISVGSIIENQSAKYKNKP
jgi:hypothetical protein